MVYLRIKVAGEGGYTDRRSPVGDIPRWAEEEVHSARVPLSERPTWKIRKRVFAQKLSEKSTAITDAPLELIISQPLEGLCSRSLYEFPMYPCVSRSSSETL